jgi:hypothetical protein
MSYQLIIPPEIEDEIAEAFDSFESSERAVSFIHALNVLMENDRSIPGSLCLDATRVVAAS